ncbi:MAG TPA: hypothetical protein VE075_06540 [Thermoanaerobaculia bacterium]|nr:hypothetical protein [Thermoanaerobaculia bacterium]
MDRRERRFNRIAPAVVIAGAVLLAGGLPAAVAQTQDPVPVRVSPALPAEGDALVFTADVLAPLYSSAGTFNLDHNRLTLYVNAPILSPQPPPQLQHLVWQVPALPAGGYSVSVNLLGVPNFGFVVQPRTASLGLVGGRFQVNVAAAQPGARPAAVQISDAGGFFSFFSPEDVEITVKVVDGRPVNGHFWVFIASMTNTPFTATVADTSATGCVAAASCPTRTYANPSDSNQNFIDVNAF